MSERTRVNAKPAPVSADETPRTKTAEKAARQLAEKKMAELVYAENYRQKLREEKAAKKSEEVKAAEKKAAEKREAEAQARRMQMEELLQKEREEMAERNAKADAVLKGTEIVNKEVKAESKPEEKPKPAPVVKEPETIVPEPTVKEEKKTLASDFAVVAPIGCFIPFTPKQKPKKTAAVKEFKAPVESSKKPDFETLFSTFSVSAGRPADYVTLEELFDSYDAHTIKPDIHSREVIELLDNQKQQSQREMDAMLETFLDLLKEQKDEIDLLKEQKEELENTIKTELESTVKTELENAVKAAFPPAVEETAETADVTLTADEYADTPAYAEEPEAEESETAEEEFEVEESETAEEESKVEESETAEEESEVEEDETAEEESEVEEDDTAEEESEAEEDGELAAESGEEDTVLTDEEKEDALWIEEEMEEGSFAVIPEELLGMPWKQVKKYVQDELKQLRKGVKEERKQLIPAKTATEAEKRRAAYEAIALCRSTVENYAVLLKLSVQNHINGSTIANYMDEEITLEHKLVKKLKRKAKRALTPMPSRMIVCLLKKKQNVPQPTQLYRKEA